MKGVAPLIRDTPFGALLADKAFDMMIGSWKNWMSAVRPL